MKTLIITLAILFSVGALAECLPDNVKEEANKSVLKQLGKPDTQERGPMNNYKIIYGWKKYAKDNISTCHITVNRDTGKVYEITDECTLNCKDYL